MKTHEFITELINLHLAFLEHIQELNLRRPPFEDTIEGTFENFMRYIHWRSQKEEEEKK